MDAHVVRYGPVTGPTLAQLMSASLACAALPESLRAASLVQMLESSRAHQDEEEREEEEREEEETSTAAPSDGSHRTEVGVDESSSIEEELGSTSFLQPPNPEALPLSRSSESVGGGSKAVTPKRKNKVAELWSDNKAAAEHQLGGGELSSSRSVSVSGGTAGRDHDSWGLPRGALAGLKADRRRQTNQPADGPAPSSKRQEDGGSKPMKGLLDFPSPKGSLAALSTSTTPVSKEEALNGLEDGAGLLLDVFGLDADQK